MGEKTYVDKHLDIEMGSFKEPKVRLKEVEKEGASCRENCDMEKGLSLGMQRLALSKLCYEDASTPNREVMMGQAHSNLSTIYNEMGLGEQSLYHAQKIVKIRTDQIEQHKRCKKGLRLKSMAISHKYALERIDPRKTGESENNDFTVECLMAVAKAMIQRSDPKCVNYLQRALVVNHELHDPDHESNWHIHAGFGDFYVLLGDNRAVYKQATAKMKDSVADLNSKKKEPDHYEKAMDEYATAYGKLAGGCKDKAFLSGGIKDARLGDMLGNAARTRCKQGNDVDAAVIFEKAVGCLESASKPNKAKLAQMCFELGVTHHKAKQYSYSKAALSKAAEYCAKTTKDGIETEPLYMLITKQQAISMYDANDVEGAKATFEALMSLQKKEYGGSSVIVAETLKYLGDVHVALKNKPLASKYYNRALRILRKRLGNIDPTVRLLEQYIRQLNLT